MLNESLFSSKTDNWATPIDFYNELNKEFNFNLDACADEYNHKCELYFNKDQNGLAQSWGGTTYFVTRLTEKTFVNGLKRHTTRHRKKTP